MTVTYQLVTSDGQHTTTLDITDEIASLVVIAGALAVAVQVRMEEFGEDADDALEALTAIYDRAEIEEAGFDAVRDFLQAVGVPFAEMPTDDEGEAHEGRT